MADRYREDERWRRGYGDERGYGGSSRSSGERGMGERAADEVRSWFGDDEAEQRRMRDSGGREGRSYGGGYSGRGGWGDEQRGQRDFDYSGSQTSREGARGASWRDMGDEDDENGYEETRQRSRSQRQAGGSGSSMSPISWSYSEVWLIPGPFVGQGPKGYQRSDDRIKEDVCERLAQHGQIDARNIEVTVANGEVTLRGQVDSRQSKRMAEDAVESVSGVRDVRNELRATQQPQQVGSGGQSEKQEKEDGRTRK